MLRRSHSVLLSYSWGQGQAAHFKRSGLWSKGSSINLKDFKHKPKSRRAQRYKNTPMEKLKLEDTLACAMHSSHVRLHSQLLKPSLPSSKPSRFLSLLVQTCRRTHIHGAGMQTHTAYALSCYKNVNIPFLCVHMCTPTHTHTHHAAPTYTFGNTHNEAMHVHT